MASTLSGFLFRLSSNRRKRVSGATRRKQSYRPADSGIEYLETRRLLSGTGLGHIESAIVDPGTSVRIRLGIDAVNPSSTLFQIAVTPSHLSSLQIESLTYRNQLNSEVLPDSRLPEVEGTQRDRLELQAGEYDIRISSQNNATGSFSLGVSLVGDANRDGRIGSEDVGAMLNHLFSTSGNFAPRLREKIDSDQSPAVDKNGDGRLNFADLMSLIEDQGVSASGVSLSVLPPNTAPALDNSGSPHFDSISESLTSNQGLTVQELLARAAGGDPITDPDEAAQTGIAVVGELRGSGRYEYDPTGQTDFQPFEVASLESATLLDSNARIRFVPESTFSGELTDSLFFRAWDQTLGSNGATGVSTVYNGGESAFSSEIETASVTVEPLEVELSFDQNTFVTSNESLITRDSSFIIDGVTVANTTIEIDSDGDGEFDDGNAIASETGQFSVSTSLASNGANLLRIRATGPNIGLVTLVDQNVHLAEGTVVRFNSSLGSFDFELLDTSTPNTVSSFLNYSNRYSNSIVHRSVDDFVIQGGGFTIDTNVPPALLAIETDPPVANEFDPQNTNLRGTLSTAQRSGDPNSFTSQWFINVVDNLQLDSVPHTVFGRIIGDGMAVVDAINTATTFNLNGVFDESALAEVPLIDYTSFTRELTGTVNIEAGGFVVSGVGTQFLTEIGSPGVAVKIGEEFHEVRTIIDDQTLQLARAHESGVTASAIRVNTEPEAHQFVTFSGIETVLDSPD